MAFVGGADAGEVAEGNTFGDGELVAISQTKNFYSKLNIHTPFFHQA